MLSFPPEVEAALESGLFYYCHFVKVEFAGVTLHLTSAGFDMTHNGQLWQANRLLVEIPDMINDLEMRLGQTSLPLSADQNLLAELALRPQVNRPVHIYLAILDMEKQPVYLIPQHRLVMYNYSDEEEAGEATIQLNLASEFANFEAVRGRRTTPASSQRFFPNDRSFEFAHKVNEPFEWKA